jgi:hypothetical protein
MSNGRYPILGLPEYSTARKDAVSAVSKALFVALLFLPGLSFAQQKEERAILSQRPLQVDLLAPLDVGKLSPGSRIFAKSRVEWNTPTCHMRAGATVSGHAVEVVRHSKDSKGSSLTILFDTAGCDEHPAHILFNLFAVIAAIETPPDIPLADYGSFGAASTAPHIGGSGGGGSHVAIPMDHSQDIAVTAAGKPVDLPKVIQSGQVFFQKNLFLAVGTGLDGGSVLSSPKGNFRIETGSQFVLMPRPVVSPEAATAIASAKSPPAPAEPASPPEAKPVPVPPPPPEIDETDVCSGSCTIASANDKTAAGSQAVSTISHDRLGYIPYDNWEYNAFNHEAALVYLSPSDLLFTFDLHKLRHRYPDGFRTEFMRTVRAVLMDPSSHAIKHVVDWEIQGGGQYVWHTTQGRVLVHKGHTLSIMDSHLNPLRSIVVPGQLAFVSLSPDGRHIAVGSLHERHTRELHNLIAQAIQIEPEEDIDIRVYDENFKLLLTSYQSTSLPPPVLSNDGQIRILPTGHNKWRITDHKWDRTDHVVATVQSDCRPDISTPLAHALFVVGCKASPLQNWYRMLRSDGHPILLGRGSSREIGQTSSSSNASQFAVRVVNTEHAKANGDFFHKSDLQTQEISVYRTADGKRTFETSSDPSLVEQSYALSPTGNQLAILTDGKINFYKTP